MEPDRLEVIPPQPKSGEEIDELILQATSFTNNVTPIGAKKGDKVNQ